MVPSPTFFNVHLLLLLCSLYIFYTSFLLQRSSLKDTSECGHIKEGSIQFDPCTKFQRFNRAVIVVIDALYIGFVTEKTSRLKVIRESVEFEDLESRIFRFRADAPTTTLQRVKALTTGTLPTFIDAGSNFFSYEIVEDSWVRQLAKSKRIHVVGDEVWEVGLNFGLFFGLFRFQKFSFV